MRGLLNRVNRNEFESSDIDEEDSEPKEVLLTASEVKFSVDGLV